MMDDELSDFDVLWSRHLSHQTIITGILEMLIHKGVVAQAEIREMITQRSLIQMKDLDRSPNRPHNAEKIERELGLQIGLWEETFDK